MSIQKNNKAVILSIKPEFSQKIFNGTKKYEFRKIIHKDKKVKTVIVYESSPTQKVIGEFEIDRILYLDPKELWQKTKKDSGITKDFFFQYFADKDFGYALKIKKTKRYKKPLCIKKDFSAIAPQSFLYYL